MSLVCYQYAFQKKKGIEQHVWHCHMILQHRAEREDQLPFRNYSTYCHVAGERRRGGGGRAQRAAVQCPAARDWTTKTMLLKLQASPVVSDRSVALSVSASTALLCEWLRPPEASREEAGFPDCPSTTPSTPGCRRTRRAPRETVASGSWSPPRCCSL